MTIAASCVWEVRTAGNDGNGGGYVSGGGGTDYSQQNSAQVNFNGSSITATGSTGSAVITITGYTCGAGDVGNVLHIGGGTNFIAGYYQIISRSGQTWTLDRPCASGSASAMTGNMGGALASPGQAAANMVGGNYCWIKAGTYTVTSASTNVTSGCMLLPAGTNSDATKVFGYNSTRGDYSTQPEIIAGNNISSFTLIKANGSIVHIENLTLNGNGYAGAKGIDCNGQTVTIYLCNFASLVNAIVSSAAGATATACYASSCSGTAFEGINYYGCVAASNAASGFGVLNPGAVLVDCLSVNNSGSSSDGFDLGNSNLAVNCTAYGNGQHGFNGSSALNVLINCLSVANTGYGFTATTTEDNNYLYNCAGEGNGSGNINTANILPANTLGFLALTGNPINNAGSNDFSLNSNSGAGASCRAAGLLGAFPGTSTTSYLDVGAVQAKYSAGALIPGVICARPHPSQFQ